MAEPFNLKEGMILFGNKAGVVLTRGAAQIDTLKIFKPQNNVFDVWTKIYDAWSNGDDFTKEAKFYEEKAFKLRFVAIDSK